jgi:hypothetical protein
VALIPVWRHTFLVLELHRFEEPLLQHAVIIGVKRKAGENM